MSELRPGQHVVAMSSYHARGFQLAEGEAFPDDASTFDRASHSPRLVSIAKGQRFAVLGALGGGQVFVRTAQDGAQYACLLLPGSFQSG